MLRYDSGELCFEGYSLPAAADEFDTPFFLLSERRLLANLRALQAGLAHGAEEGREEREVRGPHDGARLGGGRSWPGETASAIRYVAKAGNELVVLQCLSRAGAGVMASHVDEARLAVRAACPPDEIWLQKAVLTPVDVRASLELGVHGFHVARPEDAGVVERVAAGAGVPSRVALRLRPGGSRASRLLSPLRYLSSRMGLDRPEAIDVARALRDSRSAEVVGLNVYAGTQLRSPRRLLAELDRMVDLAAALAADPGPGVRVSEIVLGGGIPSPGLRLVRPGNLLARLRDVPPGPPGASGPQVGPHREFARALARRHAESCRRAGLEPRPRLVLEVGRCLVGDAGVLVTRVLGRRGRWIFVDASHGHLPEPPARFWRPVLPAAEPADGRRRLVHVAGSRVNTMDVMEPWRRLPPLAAGDLLVLGGAGAYSITRADRYGGLPPPVVWLDAGGGLRTVRRPEDVEDLAAPMIPGATTTADAEEPR